MDGLTTSLTRRTWRRRRPRKQPAPDDVALARRRASEMMQSDLVTVFSLGKQVKAIVADGAINEEDERAIESLVKRQQAVWNIILLMTTLMVGRLYGSLSSVNALTDARSSALGDTAQSRVLVVAYVLILSLSAVIMSTCMCGTVILYVYSHLLIDFDDVVWFVCEFPHHLPPVLCVLGVALFMLACAVGAPLVHGAMVGCIVAALWLLGLVGSLVAYNNLRTRFMRRWKDPERVRRETADRDNPAVDPPTPAGQGEEPSAKAGTSAALTPIDLAADMSVKMMGAAEVSCCG